MDTNQAVKFISEDKDTITIGGYGVIFGGRDLAGDTFTKSTDLMPEFAKEKLTFYDHNQGEIKGSLGTSVIKHIDDVGVWVESQLERGNQYIEAVMKLVHKGVLGYSSGSVGHLVNRANGTIKTWPIAEFSLTPTPAEPRTLGIEFIKSLVKQHPEFAVLLEEGKESKMAENEEVKQKTPVVVAEVKALPYDDSALQEQLKAVTADFAQYKVDEADRLKSIKVNALPMASVQLGTDDVTKSNNDFAQWAKSGRGTYELKAVNITTPTEGQETVPLGHHNQIISRIEEIGPLDTRLGVQVIPGKGTTLDVPIDNAAGGVMSVTSESASNTEDDPTFASKSMTLVSRRTAVRVTWEVLEDETSNLLAFLSNRASRIMVNTRNSLLLAEVATNGTEFHTFASATAFAAGEIEQVVGSDVVAPYIDDMGANLVMRNGTYMNILSVEGQRFYTDNTMGGAPTPNNGQLVGYPVHRSSYADAPAIDAKTVYFGNWDYVGVRHAPTFRVYRDESSRSEFGEVVFRYFMRTVYSVLQADAVGYGAMAAS